ncbi:MAG: Lpg1974 family pore-forming outer membrane protein [Candidatus Neptunochlamydia sp.]|nr:Lpg1974 family pore-forming outer membrane protein [Candidatus Neptunochlamydia sp.]
MGAWRLFLLVFLFPLGILHAESEIRMKGLENRVGNLEKSQTGQCRMDRLTPCAGPRVRNGMDLYISADFIYWTARLDTLTYAKKGNILSVDWSWDPGFKAGLGWIFCHGCWDMNLQYTWLYTNVDGDYHGGHILPSYDLLPVDLPQNHVTFRGAHAHFDLHYQIGDLELGRNYYVSRTLKLRPFIGMKGTWQKQYYKVGYYGFPITPLNFFNFRAKFDQALSLWGLGMRGGINTSWQFSKYIALYGNMAFTGIWLHYDIDRKDTFFTFGTSITEATTFIQDCLRVIKPAMEFALGLRGEGYFGCGRYHILAQVGWECQIWPNQTFYVTTNGHYDRYDLNLHGFTGKIRFDF